MLRASQCHEDGTRSICEQDASHLAPLKMSVPSLGIGGSLAAPNDSDPIELSLSCVSLSAFGPK